MQYIIDGAIHVLATRRFSQTGSGQVPESRFYAEFAVELMVIVGPGVIVVSTADKSGKRRITAVGRIQRTMPKGLGDRE